ncbi:hypothetical protein FHT40_004167 [Mycolicibacterium sp. BK556]|uniref:hypothetical protein n=1 Tax=unclassified Mycolicibacterium TaxID=2636767 RepID=UPI0016212145|nr:MULTISPECIES: hypothetical protein [unclassified Mycolicibacterium]MBB3604489.1 hypothetical protein [Mycolicibacterium sp. BK556]MBB3634798.1 hypothetical protein [Mycolicibacterium sp. BK607]
MNREVCKFFSGSFAALGYAHAAYAVATTRGIISEPIFLGRRWGVGSMWSEAAVYTALAVALGYAGWGGEDLERPRNIEDSQIADVVGSAPPVPVQ